MTNLISNTIAFRRATPLAIAAFLWAVVAGCGSNSPNTIAAHKIADALPHVLGPADDYEVHVDGDPMAITRGHAKRVIIDGKNVELAPKLVMNALHVDASELALNLETHQVEHSGHVDFLCTLGQIHLNQYLSQLKPTIPGLGVQIRWSDLEATVPVSAVGINTTVRVDGVLAPSRLGPDKLDFVPSETHVGSVPVPRRLVDMAMNRINPVIDLSTMSFPVTIESAKAESGRLYVAGTTKLGSKE